jgi:signal transduction histidine kinase
VEFCYLNKNRLLIPVEQTMFYVYNKSGNRMAVVAICRDISERKKADKKLVAYQKQLRSLASQLTLTEEQERRHIAAALHDRISQSLALAKIKLGALGAELSLQQENANLAAIRSLLDQCIHDTRSLMFDLSPPFLYEFGLQKALEWLLEDIEKQYGIRTRQAWDDAEKNYDDDVRILLYQSIRELLINVVKYAQAKTATVSIHHDDQGVHVRVEDDGKGFPMDQDGLQVSKKGGFGIFSIRERLQHLGGSLKIESGSLCGTKITLDLPLAERAD